MFTGKTSVIVAGRWQVNRKGNMSSAWWRERGEVGWKGGPFTCFVFCCMSLYTLSDFMRAALSIFGGHEPRSPKMESICCLETSARNYYYSLSRNIPILRKNVLLCHKQDISRRRYNEQHLTVKLLFMAKRCLNNRSDAGSHSLHFSSFTLQCKYLIQGCW